MPRRVPVTIVIVLVAVAAALIAVAAFALRPSPTPAAGTSGSGAAVTDTDGDGSGAPTHPTRVCDQPVLDSPWTYNGPAGTFTASGAHAGLPTFGRPGTDFPAATKLIVVPPGNNTYSAVHWVYQVPHAVFYFEPGTHDIEAGMYSSPDTVYVGGYTPAAGKAIIDGVDGATDGTGLGGFYLNGANGGVTLQNQVWEYLTIENYSSAEDTNAVMGAAANGDVYKYLTIGPNEYGGLGLGGSKVPPAKGEGSNGGYAVDLGSDDVVEFDCLTHNAQGAFNGQGANIQLDHNEISWNGLGLYPDCSGGSGCDTRSDGNSGGGKLFYSLNTDVIGNYVHDNYGAGIWLDTGNSGADISDNYVASNYAEGIMYEASYNATISDNTLTGNGWASDGRWPAGINGGPCSSNGISCTNGFGPLIGAGGGFPYSTIYLPNSGGNSNLEAVSVAGKTEKSRYSGELLVTGNVLRDNFGGVMVYNDDNRYPGSLNNDSSCFMPLGTLGQPNNGTYGYQSEVLITAPDADISGSAVTTADGTQTICANYGHDNGADPTGAYDQQASAPDTVQTPSPGMAVFNQATGQYLGNVARVESAKSFTLHGAPGNIRGATLVLSAYGGCGPADYYGGGPDRLSGTPRAYYWDNCIFGARNVTVSHNVFSLDASAVTGCTVTANLCGYMATIAFTPGVTQSQQYWKSYEQLMPRSSGGLGNVFSDNAYSWTGGGAGTWQFQAGDQGSQVTFAQWRAAPFDQDAGSALTG